MKTMPRFIQPVLGLTALVAAPVLSLAAPVPMSGTAPYSQDFNTLPTSGTANAWTDDTTLPAWFAQKTVVTGTLGLIVSSGGSTSGSIYSFGTGTDADRALGSVASGTPGNLAFGVLLHNDTANPQTINNLAYTGEQWRNGGNTTAHKLTFAYLKSTTTISDLAPATPTPAGWNALPAGDFTGPVASSTAAALDGNATANQAAITTNPGITVAPGEYVMLRWHDPNDTGTDHGLGIDNLSITWAASSSPLLSLSATVTQFAENATAPVVGTVTVSSAPTADLTINLSSSDTSEATVPATVTITAGNTTANFDITAVNDLLEDGSQAVTITASTDGYSAATLGLTVTDEGDAAIVVALDTNSILENAGPDTISGTVTLAAAPLAPVTVDLLSSDTTELTVPASVTIDAGQTVGNFKASPVDDGELDGDKSARITASASGYTNGYSSYITVTDVQVPPSPSLTAGAIAFTGFNADADDDVAFVALTAIPAGQVIYLNENEWNGSPIGGGGAFNTGEGSISWTSPAGGVAAGTVVTLNRLKVAARSASVGSLNATGTFDLGGSGETLYAYQGTTPSVFLAVITTNGTDSVAGTGLAANHVITLTSNVDVAAYTGSRSNKTSFAGYLDSLATAANWITDDGSGDQSADAVEPNLPFATTVFTLSAGIDYNTWASTNTGGAPADQDTDGDGIDNGAEYFMGTAGNAFNVNPGIVDTAGTKTVTWPMNPSATGVSYKVMTSENMTSWTQAAANDVQVVGGNLEFTVPQTAPKLFIRLEVTVN